MKTLILALVATLATSMALAAPRDPRNPRDPRDPGRPEQPGRPGQPGRPPGPPPGRPEPPPREEIVSLGKARLSPIIRDADTIRVNSCAAGEAGRITDVRVVAAKHSSSIEGIRVTYGNLSSDDIRVGLNLSPGQSSRWIDLIGGGRGVCVKEIRVFGTSRSIGLKKAEVEVFGRREWRSFTDLQDRREEN